MRLSLVAAPAELPITTTEARAHLAVTHALDDDLIDSYVESAVAYLDGAEGVLGRCIVTQTWDLMLDGFPSTIKLPLPEAQSVTSITYTDANGDAQTLDPSAYQVAGQRIVATDGWPSVDDSLESVTVRFVAGYGLAADVPPNLKHAVKLLVGEAYAGREGEAMESPAIQRLLRPFKVIRT